MECIGEILIIMTLRVYYTYTSDIFVASVPRKCLSCYAMLNVLIKRLRLLA